jgi:hypothetical protein
MARSNKLPLRLNQLVGTVIDGRYRLEVMIGSGGMGGIFRARREGLERRVAIKILHPQVSSDPMVAKRFEREAYSASKLDHPGIVRVSDYGTTDDGISYLVMELVEGTPLTSLLTEPMAPSKAAALAVEILEALDHAHRNKIVHRDLKPDNVLVAKNSSGKQVLKLVDFGIAKILEDKKTQERLTQTGFVYGTPHYMSPEQAAGGTVDHRADLYALGLMFYEMLAGHKAFRALDPVSLIRKQVTENHQPLPDDVPAELRKVVDRLLQKKADDRFENAREAIRHISAARRGLEDLPAAKPAAAEAIGEAPTIAEGVHPGNASTPEGVRPRAREAGSSGSMAAASGSRSARGDESNRALPLGLLALAVVVGSGALTYWLATDDPGRMPVAAEFAATEGLASELGSATGAQADVEPEPALVRIRVHANVDAKIVGVADREVFGMTNSDEGFEVDQSDQPIDLLITADGYEDHELTFIPSRSKTYQLQLEKKRKPRNVTDLRDPWARKDEPAPKASGESSQRSPELVDPDSSRGKGKPEAKKAKKLNSPDLESPFKRKQDRD